MIGSCSLIEWEYKYKRFRGAFQRSNEVPSLISRELHMIQSIPRIILSYSSTQHPRIWR